MLARIDRDVLRALSGVQGQGPFPSSPPHVLPHPPSSSLQQPQLQRSPPSSQLLEIRSKSLGAAVGGAWSGGGARETPPPWGPLPSQF